MRLVGKDKQPLDLSRQEHMDAFKKSLQRFQEDMANNSDGTKFGYMDIEGINLNPYGTPYEESSK